MKRLIAPAAAVAAVACVGVAGAGAAGPGDRVAGAGVLVEGGFDGSRFTVGAHSGPLGESPTGHVTVNFIRLGTEPPPYLGDVRDGCVVVVGNRAAVVGELPERQQFVEPTTQRLVRWAAVIVEDNGDPERGQPVDRAVQFILFEQTGERICSGDRALTTFALVPLEHGNVTVEDSLP